MTNLPDGYYAVADPDQPEQITYWRSRAGQLKPWPAKAHYGPVAYRRDVPKDHAAKVAFIEAHWEKVRAYNTRVLLAIGDDPAAAMARFAEFAVRCGRCGRTLTDDRSKVLGLGPECRQGVSETAMALNNTPTIGIAHAAVLNHQEQP